MNLLIVDGHNLLFRVYYGIPNTIKNSKGKDIRGLIGFIGSLKKYIAHFNPDLVYVIFDSETSRDENEALYEGYKKNRPEIDDLNNPFECLPQIYQALDYLNIPHHEIKHFEADDYIASVVNYYKFDECVIVSSDTDFIQLINDNVILFSPYQKFGKIFNVVEIYNKYQIQPSSYIEFKALVGDKADNIKGINSIGIKRAASILASGSIDSYLDDPSNKYYDIIKKNYELIKTNIKLITLNTKLNVEEIINQLYDKNLINFFKTFEIIEKIGYK